MLYGKINTRQQSQPFPIPAPVGGLNGRDPLANMDGKDAYLMDNAFPDAAKVSTRRGYEKHTNTVLAGPVETLEVYAGADGDQMLAWAGGKIYDTSLSAPVELETGMTSSVAINAMFSNAADNAQHLISVTGFDVPKHYNGGVIADLTITGPTSSDQLSFVFAFKERLYFAERQKLGFWYLPVGAIQGAAQYFDLAQVSRNGGALLAIASYSEGGETPQDYIVFITTKGECITYAGYDPSSAANWQLVGRYFAATPIGPRCAINYNSELVILTLEGALAFSQIREKGDASAQGVSGSRYDAITSKLGRFLSDFNLNASVHGWQGVQYPRSGMLILNVPASSSIAGDYYHYVMNTTTKAWCRFTGWNGICFTVFNDRLYFGTYDGHIMLGDEGRTDDGERILVDVKQAYNYFADERSMGPLQKHFQWASLLVSCDGQPPLSGKFNVDFQEDQPDFLNTLIEPSGSDWDVTDWDVGEWGADQYTQKFIITLNKQGYAGALWLRASMDGLALDWFATQFVMERTQGLLI